MLPTDHEFMLLYAAYGIMALLLVLGLLFATQKKFYLWNLIGYLCCLLCMVFVFLDKDNFAGGSLLVVLFYAGLVVLLHYVVFGILSLVRFVVKK